jgi:CspA family cold shock protein
MSPKIFKKISKPIKKIKSHIVKNYIYYIIFIIASAVVYIIYKHTESNNGGNPIKKMFSVFGSGVSSGLDMQQATAIPQIYGTVKFFNNVKKFGFIIPENGGPDVLVRTSEIMRAGLQPLDVGQRVSFDVVGGNNGLLATNIRLP